MRLSAIPPLIGLAALSACASMPQGSFVAPLQSGQDPAILASGICNFVSDRIPPAASTVALVPAEKGDALTPLLEADLRNQGFSVVRAGAKNQPAGADDLRYLVTPFFGGDLVRLDMKPGHIRASRYYIRNTAGYLQPGGPFTVAESAP